MILVPLKHYVPAFRFGGPIRSVANLVEAIGDVFEFRIICLSHDFRDTAILPGITQGEWMAASRAMVYYLPAGKPLVPELVRLLRQTKFGLLYLNSFFEPTFSTLPALLGRMRILPSRRIVIAPRGEFSPGALNLSRRKKQTFLHLQRWLGLYASAVWQATTSLEAEDIQRVIPGRPDIQLAPNLPERVLPSDSARPPKTSGVLRIAFLSRISPKKNLTGLIRSAGQLRGSVELDIWGPVDDKEHWQSCQKDIEALPPNVRARYRGELPHGRVREMFSQTNVLGLPTFGENYGHVIHEALAAGCPVVISDRTPWRHLREHGVGIDVAVEDNGAFVQALQSFVDMDDFEYGSYDARCRQFAKQRSSSEADKQASMRMFEHALSRAV